MDRFIVLTDSRRAGANNQPIARVKPHEGYQTSRGARHSNRHWSEDPKQAWLMSKTQADDICAGLNHNNPRVRPADVGLRKMGASPAEIAIILDMPDPEIDEQSPDM